MQRTLTVGVRPWCRPAPRDSEINQGDWGQSVGVTRQALTPTSLSRFEISLGRVLLVNREHHVVSWCWLFHIAVENNQISFLRTFAIPRFSQSAA